MENLYKKDTSILGNSHIFRVSGFMEFNIYMNIVFLQQILAT